MAAPITVERFDLPTSEAADLLGVAPVTLKRWAISGKVRGWKTPGGHWRFRRSDLERLLGTVS